MPDAVSPPTRDVVVVHSSDLHLDHDYTARLHGGDGTAGLVGVLAAARSASADVVVLAGDTFDCHRLPDHLLERAAAVVAAAPLPVVILPGNHDFHAGATDDFWKNFERPEHGRFLLLDEARAYPLREWGIDAVLYAAPCGSKYSATHALSWLEGAERPEAKFHVGIAHGSFEGLSPDLQGNYFPMKADDLLRTRLDLWLLGHIHVPFPLKPGAGDRIFYSGTHEPDGFDCRHEGRAWLLELQPDRSLRAEPHSTGQFRFREVELELRSLANLEEWAGRFRAEAARTLLKLTLRGSLPREEYARFAEVLENIQREFFFVKADFSALRVALSAEDIDREFSRESFPHRLLRELSASDPEGAALQAAFEILREAQGKAP